MHQSTSLSEFRNPIRYIPLVWAASLLPTLHLPLHTGSLYVQPPKEWLIILRSGDIAQWCSRVERLLSVHECDNGNSDSSNILGHDVKQVVECVFECIVLGLGVEYGDNTIQRPDKESQYGHKPREGS